VTTDVFGQAVLFRIDVPELPARDYVLTKPEYAAQNPSDPDAFEWTPVGSKVRRAAVPARSRLVGPGAIYSIMPCTETAARAAIETLIRRPLILLERAKDTAPALAVAWTIPDGDVETDVEDEA